MANLEAQLRLTARDNTGGAFASVGKRLNALERQARATQARTAGAAANAGRAASASGGLLVGAASRATAQIGGVVGAAMLMRKSFTEFASFDRRMTRIGITSEATAEEIKGVTKQVHAMAQDSAVPVGDVVSGLEALTAAGFSLPKAMSFLPSVVKTAAASGAAVDDIAKSAEAVGENFKISGADMQEAFDIMAKGGKMGEFELKDMARYLPSLASAAQAVGFKGADGLAEFVSMLQAVRKGTGTAEEAAGSLNNIFTKMETDETQKRFKEFGIDIRAELDKTRKRGGNLIETFENMAFKATKGDLSRLPLLIGDMEFARGIRALLTYRGHWQKMAKEVRNASGTVAEDAARVGRDAQSSVDRLSNSTNRAVQSLGRLADSAGASSFLENVGKGAERAADGFDKLSTSMKGGTLMADWRKGMEEMEAREAALRKAMEERERAAAQAETKALVESRPAVLARSEEIFGDDRAVTGLDAQIRSRQAVEIARRAREDENFRNDIEIEKQRRRLEGEVGNARDSLAANRKNFGTRSAVGASMDRKGLARIQAAETALAEFEGTVTALREARAAAEALKANIGGLANLGINRAAGGGLRDLSLPALSGGASFGFGRGGAPVANDPYAYSTAHPAPPVRPDVDNSAIDATTGKANEAVDALKALDLSVAPSVDASSITQAIGLAQQLRTIIDGIGPAAARAAEGVKAAKDAAGAPSPAPAPAKGMVTGQRRAIDREIRAARNGAYADTLQVT